MIGGVVIYGAIPQGKIKVNPILGHDLEYNSSKLKVQSAKLS